MSIFHVAISQTPSVDCSTAAAQQATVGTACNPVTFNINNVMGNPAAPTCAGFASTGEDGWAWFTATYATTIISYSNTNQDAVVFLYTGTCGALTQIDCADNTWGNGASIETLTLTTVIGQTYYIRVCRFSGTSGQMNGSLCVYSPPPISNDDCTTAEPISCGTTIVGNTTGATVEPATAGCGSTTSSSIWYTMLGDGSTVALDLCNSAFDTQISVYTGDCAALTCYAYNDDDFLCGLQSYVAFPTTAGVLYYLQVHGWGTSSGAFEMVVTCFGGGANDACADALPVNCGETLTGSTLGFGPDVIPAGCGFSSSGGVWYTVTGNGDLYTASLCGGAVYDTQISVFAGDCAALTCVDTNDDFCGAQSEVSWVTSNGVVYYILVHGYFDEGDFDLSLTCQPYVPGPQDCSGSITICNDVQFGGNSSGGGVVDDLTAANQGCLAGGENQTSWYVFQPTTTGTISFTINPTPIVDYDFAIWGPMTTTACPPVGTPLRCSFSALWQATGLNAAATDTTEGAGGDAWVAPIVVGPAQVNAYYFMCLDNFSTTTTPFVFDWTLGGVILNCTILMPVEWTAFDGEAVGMHNLLQWTTASEINNSHFEVMSSADGIHFSKIGEVTGNGNSFDAHQYTFDDRSPAALTTYYQLVQVDYNGARNTSAIIAVQRAAAVQVMPNPFEQYVQLTLTTANDESLLITLSDATGRVVQSQSYASGKAAGMLRLDTSVLPAGIYTLRITTSDDQVVATEKTDEAVMS